MANPIQRQLVELDRVLRGDATRLSALRAGTVEVSIGGMSLAILVLAMLYGLCMGCFSLFRPDGSYDQVIASTVKVPLLFFLTLAVTFPSLYVFNALVGSRLTVPAVLRLLIAALAVNLAVLASLGPIVAFFSVSTTSYPFMLVLNVLVFTVSGLLGLSFLRQTLNRLTFAEADSRGRADATPIRATLAENTSSETSSSPDSAAANTSNDRGVPPPDMSHVTGESDTRREEPTKSPMAPHATTIDDVGALDNPEGQVFGQHVKKVFLIWMGVFGLVGAQMGWVLRPFIGSPDRPFEWFRERESNFFQAVWQALISLFS